MADRLDIAAGERLEVVQDTPDVLTVEACYDPRGDQPPAHYHPRQDEHFEVLEGSLRVQAGGAQRDLHAGDILDIPRGSAHRMWNPADGPARVRWETRPAGSTKEWFSALAALQGTRHVNRHGRPKPLAFAAPSASPGNSALPPPWHGSPPRSPTSHDTRTRTRMRCA